MIPGKPGFERIKWCFENTLAVIFPMVLASVDPHGISVPIDFPATVGATKMSFYVKCTPLENIVIPDTATIRTIRKNNLRWRKDVSDLYEWIGMAAMQSDRIILGDSIDPFLCVYSAPPQTTTEFVASSGCLLEISGLIPPPSVLRIFEAVRALLDEPTDLSWANFTVWGFQDAPISWLNKEHGHLVSGENMYSFFLWSSSIQYQENTHPDTGIYVLLESVAAHDAHS
ncbi:Ribonuclease P protein subunit p40 [Entomortierella chlamydospora]|uniref:Ribonuclease P protein subunit p40 n=1 Tax=Entomortierella chlamydospora TaxID=101097 RepID=A0A9P6T0S1_9FUNG|nr:Ribonuclease P protein subunit p40 [Entomortierella chlamydospora]